MKLVLLFWMVVPALLPAQGEPGQSAVGLSDLPAAETQPKLPGLDGAAPAPDLGNIEPSESPSIPQLRPAEPEAVKAKDRDWAAEAMIQKKEEAKKKEQEKSALAEQKARESQLALEQEKKDKAEKNKASQEPAVKGPAAPGLGEGDAQKLPAVTGLDGVKPRGTLSGDGRVQPGFDSFTGPSSTGPLGKDFQSGAKPIMPNANLSDGRMQVPPQPPEPPSGGYKRISQDPYSSVSGYGEKKTTPPPQPKSPPKNPPAGNPLTPGTPAGLSPYDNNKKVPDPRSQRRF